MGFYNFTLFELLFGGGERCRQASHRRDPRVFVTFCPQKVRGREELSITKKFDTHDKRIKEKTHTNLFMQVSHFFTFPFGLFLTSPFLRSHQQARRAKSHRRGRT